MDPASHGFADGVLTSGALAGFNIIKVLIKCRHSTLFLAQWTRHNMLVVLKIYASNRLSRSQTSAVWQEAQLPVFLTSHGVPNICKVHWAFQQPGVIVLVQQFCEQGNLSQVLTERRCALSEREACCMLVVPMLVTLWHLQRHKIIHADIKLENIFVSNHKLYLGDFGASQRLVRPLKSMMGTVDFMAPEILRAPRRKDFSQEALYNAAKDFSPGFGFPVDVWAMGVTLYEAICGRRPWFAEDKEGTIQDILAFRMHDFPASISPSARAFVLAALTHSAELRPTPEQLLSHPWVTGYVKGVTNVLSDDRRVSAEQLAADVVRVTGSSETAVSMLRSIGSLQGYDRPARLSGHGSSTSGASGASGGVPVAYPPPLHHNAMPTMNPFDAAAPAAAPPLPHALRMQRMQPPPAALPPAPAFVHGTSMPMHRRHDSPPVPHPAYTAPDNALDEPPPNAEAPFSHLQAAALRVAPPSQRVDASATAISLEPLPVLPHHRSRTVMGLNASHSSNSSMALGESSSLARLAAAARSMSSGSLAPRGARGASAGSSQSSAAAAGAHFSGSRAGELDAAGGARDLSVLLEADDSSMQGEAAVWPLGSGSVPGALYPRGGGSSSSAAAGFVGAAASPAGSPPAGLARLQALAQASAAAARDGGGVVAPRSASFEFPRCVDLSHDAGLAVGASGSGWTLHRSNELNAAPVATSRGTPPVHAFAPWRPLHDGGGGGSAARAHSASALAPPAGRPPSGAEALRSAPGGGSGVSWLPGDPIDLAQRMAQLHMPADLARPPDAATAPLPRRAASSDEPRVSPKRSRSAGPSPDK